MKKIKERGREWKGMLTNVVYNEDCFETFKRVDDKSIDMILCDLPYGTTACKWDTRIPLEPLWKEYKRIIKKNGAIVLTASQPFTSILVMSNLEWFRYEWIWDKKRPVGFMSAKYKPMVRHENILVFGEAKIKYNPQMVLRDRVKWSKNYGTGEVYGGKRVKEDIIYKYTHKNPTTLIEISNANQTGKVHPTQKPVALFEYLIKTYTNEGDLILDNCIGSGTTAIACLNTNRNYIGCELDKGYYDICIKRIEEHNQRLL